MNEPKIHVGISSGPRIEFVLHTPFLLNGVQVPPGKQTAVCRDNKIVWGEREYGELRFDPLQGTAGDFELLGVTIGIGFHWERREDQRFPGALKIIVEDGKLTAINTVPVEDYLISVISSEMSATASPELLKAHAVISRSWLLAQIQKNKEIAESRTEYSTSRHTGGELIKWYDREDHINFDVCADDHCQRYQGTTRASTEIVRQVVDATRGQVLSYGGKICDARFSKCCGGAFEEFRSCWEDMDYPYLKAQRDSKTETNLPALTAEQEAEKWIRSSPPSFCNTTDEKILSQVLNNYDRETPDFYRWKVSYTQEELSTLIARRSGMDFGDIIDLIPVERGTSARLIKLRIVGTKRALVIGKELEIRRTLSPSHLYSSAFVADKEDVRDGIPGRFVLTGAGWGHGVGLCQIGAAVMGEEGYAYDEILPHYYIGASIDKLY